VKNPSEMTNDEVNEAVAVEVMGWTVAHVTDEVIGIEYDNYVDSKGVGMVGVERFSPSTDIAAAFLVADKVMESRHVRMSLLFGSHMRPNAEFFDVATGQHRFGASAETRERAICEAAILADSTHALEAE